MTLRQRGRRSDPTISSCGAGGVGGQYGGGGGGADGCRAGAPTIPYPEGLNNKPYQQPPIGVNLLGLQDSDESDLEDSEKLISDLISESDRPIFAVLKAASRGDLSAQSFLMDKYTRGELSPTMREMMEGMIEDGYI